MNKPNRSGDDPEPDRQAPSPIATRLGSLPTLIAVAAVIGMATVVATQPDQSQGSLWVAGSIALALILLGVDWWQRSHLNRATDHAIDALIATEGELRERERQLQNHVARQAKILRMEREIAGSGDTNFVALIAARAASTVSGAKAVSVWTLDHEGASMRLLAQSNWEQAGEEHGRWLPVTEGAIGAAIAERQPIGVVVEGTTHWVWPLVVGNHRRDGGGRGGDHHRRHHRRRHLHPGHPRSLGP